MIDVRPEQPEDVRLIFVVHAASFPTTGEGQLVDDLRAAGRLSLSLVALDGESRVGHVAFSPVTLPGALDGVGLAPLAVLPEHRRHGIAERLVRDGLDACAQAGYGFVVVLGEPAYYSRFGFTPASQWGLHDEYDGGDAFQALELRPDSIPAAGGLVQYAPEFAAFGS